VEVRKHGDWSVGEHFLVEVEFDAADVGGANSGFEVETLSPSAENVNSLVVFEDIFVNVNVCRFYGAQVANDVASVIAGVDGGRVEAVVVSRREVNDHVEELVASGLNFLEHGGHLGVVCSLVDLVFVDGITLDAEHELVETIAPALYAVNSAELGVDLAASQNCSIAWRAHADVTIWLTDFSNSSLKVTSEELGKGLVVTEVRVFDLLHVDAVGLRKSSVHDISKRVWDIQRTDPAGKSRDIPCNGDNVLGIVVLLGCLVDGIQRVPGGKDET